MILLKNVSNQEIRQTNCLIMPRRTNYSFESSESYPHFQLFYMIRIRIFGPRELFQN